MGKYFYGSNGRPYGTDGAEPHWEKSERLHKKAGETIDEIAERCGDGTGIAERIDRVYMTLGTAIMGRLKAGALQQRQLASGIYSYTVERRARLEPGIEAMMMPDDTVAVNFEDFFSPPEGTELYSFDHTRWIAQQILDYDFGVQQQRRALEEASANAGQN